MSGMQIFIKDPRNGRTVAIDCESSDTVLDLKERIMERVGAAATNQRLIFAGRQLENHRTLADYHITKESNLSMSLIVPAEDKKQESDPAKTNVLSRMFQGLFGNSQVSDKNKDSSKDVGPGKK